MKIITFLTDFGTKSGYVAQMKGVASSITDAKLIDIDHEISPQNVREGAFVLLTTVSYFPVGTVHVAVIDPGVGTNRRNLLIATKTHVLIGPDNGLLIPTAHFLGNFIVYEITNKKYMLNTISNTFHGRDIFTPVAAHIINGVPFEKFGNPINDFIDLDLGKPIIEKSSATGKIIHIDKFGNIITNIDGINLRKVLDFDKKIMIFIGQKQKEIPFLKSYAYIRKNSYLATIGSSNFFEIGINQGNAAKKLDVKIDDDIKILFT